PLETREPRGAERQAAASLGVARPVLGQRPIGQPVSARRAVGPHPLGQTRRIRGGASPPGV
ncbi:MAG: hypothetical protein U1E05_25695, partial [Patescibacteria group bacterium]|nr:hypothetical protein [Patescibacteria group bacterium]